MGWMQLFHRLELQDHLVLDDDIGNIVADDFFVVEDFNGHFLFSFETGLFQFDQQSILVDALQETKSQRVVHFVCAFDDFCREIFVFQLCFFFGTDDTDCTDTAAENQEWIVWHARMAGLNPSHGIEDLEGV